MFANAQEAEQLAGGAELNQGVYLVPAFSGLGAPHWRQDARAAIVGLTAHSDRRHIARAALESMAYQVRDVLDMLQAESGRTGDRAAMRRRTDRQRIADAVHRRLAGRRIARAATSGLFGARRGDDGRAWASESIQTRPRWPTCRAKNEYIVAR